MSFHYQTICDRCRKVADDWDTVPEGWITLQIPTNHEGPEHLCDVCCEAMGIPKSGFTDLRMAKRTWSNTEKLR